MALPLERTIMAEIGLGSHYSWYNGSSSCGYIRCKAVDRLPDAIRRHAESGEEIIQPYEQLMSLARSIAGSSYVDEYSLTKVWQACSDIIAAHIRAFGDPQQEQQKEFRRLEEYLRSEHLRMIHIPLETI